MLAQHQRVVVLLHPDRLIEQGWLSADRWLYNAAGGHCRGLNYWGEPGVVSRLSTGHNHTDANSGCIVS